MEMLGNLLSEQIKRRTQPNEKATKRVKSTISRKVRRDRLARSPMSVRHAAARYKCHVVSVSKGLREDKDYKPFRLAPYRELPEKAKLQLQHEALLADPLLTVFKVTSRLNPDTADKFILNPSLRYYADEFRRALRKVLPNQALLFYQVMEDSYGVPLHFHGVIAIPTAMVSEQLILDIIKAIKSSPLSNKFRQYWNNLTVDIGSTYKRNKGLGQEKPIGSGWPSYITKDAMNGVDLIASLELKKKGAGFLRRNPDERQRKRVVSLVLVHEFRVKSKGSEGVEFKPILSA